MAISDSSRVPVIVRSVERKASSLENGASFEVYEALRGSKPVGALRLDWTRKGILLQTIAGHAHAEYAPVFARHAEAVLTFTGRITVFNDFWEMPTYDSEFRIEETKFVNDHKPQYDGIHALLKSRIVAMGVSVASLAMGGLIKSHANRAEFDALLLKEGIPLKRPVPWPPAAD